MAEAKGDTKKAAAFPTSSGEPVSRYYHLVKTLERNAADRRRNYLQIILFVEVHLLESSLSSYQ